MLVTVSILMHFLVSRASARRAGKDICHRTSGSHTITRLQQRNCQCIQAPFSSSSIHHQHLQLMYQHLQLIHHQLLIHHQCLHTHQPYRHMPNHHFLHQFFIIIEKHSEQHIDVIYIICFTKHLQIIIQYQ